MIDLLPIVSECSPNVSPDTMISLIRTESGGNPNALAAVNLAITDQPKNKEDAKQYFNSLVSQGYNVSVGLGQVNMKNFSRFGLDIDKALDPCENLKVSQLILSNCYDRAAKEMGEGQQALKSAFSCYYSNNFKRGFIPDDSKGMSYVDRVYANHQRIKIPAINFEPPSQNPRGREEEQEEQEKENLDLIDEDSNLADENSWDVFNELND